MSDETTDRIRETLATPAASEDVRDGGDSTDCPTCGDELAVYWEEGRIRGVVSLDEPARVALLRTPSGEGEAEAQKVEAVLRRWNRLAGDVGGSEGPLTETEIAAISRDVADALRSEAPGEVWRRENERLTKAWHAAHEARRRAEDEARLWFDRYQALRSEAPGEVWREVDDLLARLERFEYDAAGESEEYWRVVTIRDRIAAARGGEGGGE